MQKEVPEELSDHDPLTDDLLLLEMIRAISSKPESVKIEHSAIVNDIELKKILTIIVDNKDYGRVIGKNGRMISILTNFMGAVGNYQGYKIEVKLEMNGRVMMNTREKREMMSQTPVVYRNVNR